ncbi:MAG TPA: hypothetical protein PLQ35_17570 [bacterium]|nr:hypothetical protein [bacterium]
MAEMDLKAPGGRYDLEGFTGIGHSVEDCLFQAKWGMKEHVEILRQERISVPPDNPDPMIIVQNEKKPAGV